LKKGGKKAKMIKREMKENSINENVNELQGDDMEPLKERK
jgi:hypothetical protein